MPKIKIYVNPQNGPNLEHNEGKEQQLGKNHANNAPVPPDYATVNIPYKSHDGKDEGETVRGTSRETG